ncbi:hypothetical protein [Streptomyces mirabilis]
MNAGLHGYYVDLTEEAVRGCGFGFWSGPVLGLAAALHRTAWGDFTLSRL